MLKPVYTYAVNLPGQNPENETKLLLLWKRNWQWAGYEPIVLNEAIAQRHPLYPVFSKRIDELPTINVRTYERACFLRWLAIVHVGGGLSSDHDVFCYDQKWVPGRSMPDKIVSFQNHVPCLVWGSKLAYENMVKAIMDYQVTAQDLEDGRQVPHVSDMHMMVRGGIPFSCPQEIVKSYGDAGWEKAKIVHYSNASTVPAKKSPRHLHILELRNWL